MTDEVVVKIDQVSFRYNRELVLEDITLDIRRGEFLGIIGPNGSGKTTLLKIILGLLKPTKGKVWVFDPHKVGYVPQKIGSQILAYPITVEEVVGMAAKKGDIEEGLESVGIADLRHVLVGELSGGQQQRVFIARALVSKPELLILDEPTGGVDTGAQVNFYELLRKLNRELKLTLILVSHDIDVVANEVTTLTCLNGKLFCHLPPKEFIKEDYLEQVYGKDLKFIVHGH